MTETARHYADDEISLIDIWHILVRWKWLVVGVFALTLAGAAVYLSTAQPVYESETSFYIGQLDERQVLEAPAYVLNRIQADHRDSGEPARVAKAISDRKDARLITVKVQSNSPESAHALALRIQDEVTEAHDAKFREGIQKMEAEQHAVLKLVEEGQRQLARAEKVSVSNAETQVALLTARMNLTSQLAALQARAAALEQGSQFAKPTEVITAAARPAAPARPKPKLIFALAVFMGLFLGGFAAFLAHFIQGIRVKAA